MIASELPKSEPTSGGVVHPGGVVGDIVEEHFEEFDFLWELRQGVLDAPDWTRKDLAELEERAEAHLDGLRVAGSFAIELARPLLFSAEASARTAATLLFMDSGDADLAKEVLEAFVQAESHEARDGIRIGLRYSRIGHILEALREHVSSEDPSLAVCSSDVLAFQRDQKQQNLGWLVKAEDPAIRSLAFGCMSRRREALSNDALRSALADEHKFVQRSALRAAAMSGMKDIESICRNATASAESPNLAALSFLGVIGNESDFRRIKQALARADHAPAALDALGALGSVPAIPRLLEAMSSSDEETALAAGAAFVRIVGPIDIESDVPEAFEDRAQAPPIQIDEEELDFDAEFEEVPLLPDPGKAQAWWTDNRNQFNRKLRYQCGLDVTDVSAVLSSTSLESRRDLYLGHCMKLGAAAAPDIELESQARLHL